MTSTVTVTDTIQGNYWQLVINLNTSYILVISGMNIKSAEETTTGIIEALQEFSKRSLTSVTDVRLVIFQKEVLDIYHKILRVIGSGGGKNQLRILAI